VLDTSQDAAVKQWSTYLWNRIETGSPSEAAAAFAFTDPALASPLFQPLRAAKKTLEGLEVAVESPCYWVATTPTGDLVAIGDAALIKATKDYMTLGKLSTDLGGNIAGTSEHLNKILSSEGAQFGFEGGSLVSYGVQPDTVAAAYVGGAPKFDVGPGTMNAIGVILGTAPAIAVSASSPSESLRAIRGGASRTDDFLTQLALTLWYVDVNQVVMTRVDAMFGAYGDLPLALVQFEDAYVLVDTVNGTLAGPFEPTSPFDATSLLANHPDAYEPDSHILYVDDKGCTAGAPQPPPPQLKIRCVPIGTIPGTPAVHCWIELQIPGPGGERNVCSGHPEYPTFVPDPVCEPLEVCPWGPIRTYCGAWDASPDKNIPGDPSDPIDEGTRTTLISCREGVDVRAVYDCVSQVMARITACNIRYDPIRGPNSNTVVHFALSYCMEAAGCRMISPDFTPRTSRGRLPVGWDSEEGMRQIGGVRAGRSASDHSAHAASATPTSASSTTAFPTRGRRMTDA
jgi:hypothetical protein